MHYECFAFYYDFIVARYADDNLGLNPQDCYELAFSCLGACIWTLKRCQIDKQLLSMKQFEVSKRMG